MSKHMPEWPRILYSWVIRLPHWGPEFKDGYAAKEFLAWECSRLDVIRRSAGAVAVTPPDELDYRARVLLWFPD